jgi:eukaryotic-like serine/threonine-protein kinase
VVTLLAPGHRIGETLVVDRLLGEGAFAEVHRVEHALLGWQAMKVFKRVGSLAETRAMLGEARLLSTLGHPHVVRLFDAGTVGTADGVRGWFTMEYVAGGSLERLVAGYRGGVPVDVAVDVVEQVASGLAVAHDRQPPILHRDLTLANVLVGFDDGGIRVRIGDFGLARRADPVSRTAGAQGTYAFMAPEVLRGGDCSCATDVWALGTIAYLMLTGTLPYDDGGLFSPARFDRSLLPPSRFNDDVDAGLNRIVTAMLAVPPGERPASARAIDLLAQRRARALADPPPEPPAPGPDPGQERGAARLVEEAIATARRPDRLARAADLLEEAVTLSPALREAHLHRLVLWRKGVIA